MIVPPRPGVLSLLFTLRGSIVPLIAPRVGIVALIAAAVTVVGVVRPGALPGLPATPFTLLGLGLSIFLGFRNSACYERWWDARRQWGAIVTTSRDLGRFRGGPNVPDSVLRRLASVFAEARAAGVIGENLFVALDGHLGALAVARAACERIRSTPTPFAYTLLLHRTAWVFCLLLPFALRPNTRPLDALAIAIAIEAPAAPGVTALPPPLAPVDGVLS